VAHRKISKQEAARRQLNAAIEWFLEDRDYLPIYNIASSVFVITEDIARKNGIQDKTFYGVTLQDAGLDEMIARKKEMGIKHGFLKHADRDDISEINDVREMQLASVLYFASRNYSELFKEQSVQMELMEAFMYSAGWNDVYLEIGLHEKYLEQIHRYRLIAKNEGNARLKQTMLNQLYAINKLKHKRI
jgi:hypothetical protein